MPTLWLLAITVCIICLVFLQRGCQSGRERRWEYRQEWREQRDKRKEDKKDSWSWWHKDRDKGSDEQEQIDGDEADKDRRHDWLGRRTSSLADESDLTPEPPRLLWNIDKANSIDK